RRRLPPAEGEPPHHDPQLPEGVRHHAPRHPPHPRPPRPARALASAADTPPWPPSRIAPERLCGDAVHDTGRARRRRIVWPHRTPVPRVGWCHVPSPIPSRRIHAFTESPACRERLAEKCMTSDTLVHGDGLSCFLDLGSTRNTDALV